MYGKHFESMYEGSMYGSGVAVFAVWGYVISHARNGTVELNPKRLADTLGGTVDEITSAIAFLCGPDPSSRHKEHDGRRMLKEGEFQYQVPSWEHYQAIRNEVDRREYNRLAQQRCREKKKQTDLAAETRELSKKFTKKDLSRVKAKNDGLSNQFSTAYENGDSKHADNIAASEMPNNEQPT